MLFTKLLLNPIPHTHIKNLDTSTTKTTPKIKTILVTKNLSKIETPQKTTLTNEPQYENKPILTVTTINKKTTTDTIKKIQINLKPLPFVLDPFDNLHPNNPNTHLKNNSITKHNIQTIK